MLGFSSRLFESPITVVSEHRLGFGVSLSSNIGQRFAESILDSFRRRFDAEEEQLFNLILDPITGSCTAYSALDLATWRSSDGLTEVCRWILERRRLTL